MDDLISRAVALKGLEDLNIASFYEENEHSKEAYTEVKTMLRTLPSATQSNTSNTLSALDCIYGQVAIDAIRESTLKYTGFIEMEMYTDDDAVEAIEGLPSAQPERMGWIPVTERLPDKEGSYLCTVQGYLGKTTYLRIADFQPDIYVEYDIEEHKPGFIDYDSEYGFYEVTKVLAWMPLPQSYKEADNG